MSQLESTPPAEASPPPTKRERLPHSRWGIISFRLAVASVMICVLAIVCAYGLSNLRTVDIWVFFAIQGVFLCGIFAASVAFFLGSFSLLHSRTRNIYGILGFCISCVICIITGATGGVGLPLIQQLLGL